MNDLIAISTLNDFIFCPYSIYLHQVYVDADEDMYHAKPQTRGRNAPDCDELTIPSLIVKNKIENQQQLLFNTRRKDSITQKTINCCYIEHYSLSVC